jgi:hypothetical protein
VAVTAVVGMAAAVTAAADEITRVAQFTRATRRKNPFQNESGPPLSRGRA